MEGRLAEEWLERIYIEMKGRPHDQLFQYFRGATRKEDLTTHVLNLANETIKKVFPDAPAESQQITEEDSRVERHYNVQCAQYLYYRCVHQHPRQVAHQLSLTAAVPCRCNAAWADAISLMASPHTGSSTTF